MTFRLGVCSLAAALLVGCPEPPPMRATSTTSGKTVTLFPVMTTEVEVGSSVGPSTGSSDGALDADSSSGASSRGTDSSATGLDTEQEATSEEPGSSCNAPSPPCSPGMTQTTMQACGDCGMQAASRRCSQTCEWEEWEPSEACTGEGECHPGATMSKTVSCACGGSKIQTATCTDACAFDAYSDSTVCDFRCCTRVVYCNTMAASDPDVRNMYPGRGTWCSQTSSTCSADEAMEGCLQRVGDICEDGLVSTLHVDYL